MESQSQALTAIPAIEDLGHRACRIILVRHALSEGDGRFAGQLDTKLTDAGRAQLPGLAQKLATFAIAAAYASDLMRARDTAAAIAEQFGVSLECRAGLREMYFGEWQGLSWSEIEAGFPQMARLWLRRFPRERAPAGESFSHFKSRIVRELCAIVGANAGRCVLVVTHAGVIRMLLASALRVPEKQMFASPQPHGGVNVIDYRGGSAKVRCMNA